MSTRPDAIETETFLASTHRGRAIATHRHGNAWLVYLDQVLQPNRMFATAEDALAWLRRAIDTPEIRPGSLAWLAVRSKRSRPRIRA
jgi:hypothetical protein